MLVVPHKLIDLANVDLKVIFWGLFSPCDRALYD